jgi:hypothetical protein
MTLPSSPMLSSAQPYGLLLNRRVYSGVFFSLFLEVLYEHVTTGGP